MYSIVACVVGFPPLQLVHQVCGVCHAFVAIGVKALLQDLLYDIVVALGAWLIRGPHNSEYEDIHQYAMTGLNLSSCAARKAKREISAAFSGAGIGVVILNV
jgi:hypothetical protein